MRINDNFHDDCDSCPYELHERAEEVFRCASQMTEAKKLLTAIREESVKLRKLILTEEEQKERKKIVSDFDAKMQGTVYSTLKNLEAYQQFGWKELLHEGEDNNERVDSTL